MKLKGLSDGQRVLSVALVSVGVLAMFGLLALQAFGGMRPAQAQTCAVTSLADSGPGTLRGHIADAACDLINFDAGILPGTIALSSQLTIGRNVTIDGPGPSQLTVRRQSSITFRVLNIESGTTVTITGITITGGHAGGGRGGGILNRGTLSLRDATITGNIAKFGGGVSNEGTLSVENSAVSSNSSDFGGGVGGGIWNSGDLMMTDADISDNSANFLGGGVWNSGILTVTGGTISSNSVDGLSFKERRGGGIGNSGTLTVTGGTISDNYADFLGGGIWNSGTSTVTNSTLLGNFARTAGGGIYSAGTLMVTNSTISSNGGGGIWNIGTVTVTDGTISGNSGISGGGIINESGGEASVSNTTISGNSNGHQGGGILNRSASTMNVTNSTISGNFAQSGAGIENSGGATLTVSHTTISGNTATRAAGGGIGNTGMLTIKNSIVANSPSGGNCSGTGTFNTLGSNLADDSTCIGFTEVSDLMLDPLADNGGPSLTHALLPGSPAIDAAGDCTLMDGVTPVATDQRGAGRPVDGDGDSVAVCDIGAFEFAAVPPGSDSDGDGIPDGEDACPDTLAGAEVDSAGCSQSQVDGDLDGVCDPGTSSDRWCAGSDACPDEAEDEDGFQDQDGCPEVNRRLVFVPGWAANPGANFSSPSARVDDTFDCIMDYVAGDENEVDDECDLMSNPIFEQSGFYFDRQQDLLSFSYTGLDSGYFGINTWQPLFDSAQAFDNQFGLWRAVAPPDTSFDIVSHSLGGVVVAFWLATMADAGDVQAIHSVLALGSPLHGLRLPWCIGAVLSTMPVAVDLCISDNIDVIDQGINRRPALVLNNADDFVTNGCIGEGAVTGNSGVWASAEPRLGPTTRIVCLAKPGATALQSLLNFISDDEHEQMLRPVPGSFQQWIQGLILNDFFDDRSSSVAAPDWERRSETSRIQGTLTASSRAGDTATFSIPGGSTKVVWITSRGPLQGNAAVKVCGQNQPDLDLRGFINDRLELTYDVPADCPVRELKIEVIPTIESICTPDIEIPGRTITLPWGGVIEIPPRVIEGKCITPEVTGEVQIDGFEVFAPG